MARRGLIFKVHAVRITCWKKVRQSWLAGLVTTAMFVKRKLDHYGRSRAEKAGHALQNRVFMALYIDFDETNVISLNAC